MDADERELFADALRAATGSSTGAALDTALTEIGWRDALAVDRRAAVGALFDAQGRDGATSSALGWLLGDALDVDTAAVVLPVLGSPEPPGNRHGDTVAVHGLGLASLADGDEAVAVAPVDGGCVAVRVPAGCLHLEAIRGLDPTVGLISVTTTDTRIGDAHAVDWPTAVAHAQLALAHELIGASRTMLDLARTHAVERVQFGQPIAKFQAIRHRLAETLVAIETAEAAADGAWLDGTGFGAGIAKAVAGRSARTVARHCQQVLAGIGFTAEHPFHTHVRRMLVLDRLFGDPRTLTRTLGRDLLASRQLPPMLPL